MSGIEVPEPPIEPPVTPPAQFVPSPGSPPVTAPKPGPIAEPEPIPAPPETQPGIPATVPDLGKLSGLIVLLGLIALLAGLTSFFNWLFRTILSPFTRGRTPPQLTSATLGQGMTSTLGSWLATVDADLGVSFNKLALSTSRTAGAILAGAQVSHAIAVKVSGQQVRTAAQQHAADRAQQTAQRAQQQAQAASQAVHATAALAAAAAATNAEQIRALEQHITHLIEPELENLRSRIPKLENGVATGWDLLKQHDEALGIAGLTAGVAAALGRIGGGWIACEANQLVGAALCRSDSNALRNLLKGLIPLLGFAELCEILKAMTSLAASGPIQESLDLLSGLADDLLACTKSERPTPLQIAAPDLGPLTAWAALAA